VVITSLEVSELLIGQ